MRFDKLSTLTSTSLSLQGALVAIFFCFRNNEVCSVRCRASFSLLVNISQYSRFVFAGRPPQLPQLHRSNAPSTRAPPIRAHRPQSALHHRPRQRRRLRRHAPQHPSVHHHHNSGLLFHWTAECRSRGGDASVIRIELTQFVFRVFCVRTVSRRLIRLVHDRHGHPWFK